MAYYEHRKVGGANYYITPNVFEAIKLAEEFKASGTYDYFRGEASHLWQLKSTLARRGKSFIESQSYLNVCMLLAGILENHNATKYMFENSSNEIPDIFYAIAQHYGIPTNFLDFTRSPTVAAFFCLDNRPVSVEDDFCRIFCLNRRNFSARIEVTNRFCNKGRPVELIEIDVSNLWRLQAQEGLFLYLPIIITQDLVEHNFEDYCFPLDGILFPVQGDEIICEKALIYPTRKSQLEMVLDQFFYMRSVNEFDLEAIINRHISSQTKPSSNQRQPVKVSELYWPVSKDNPADLFENSPTKDYSWMQCNNNAWHPKSTDSWHELQRLPIAIDINMDLRFDEIRSKVNEQLLQHLLPESYVKRRLIELEVTLINYQPSFISDQQQALKKIKLGIEHIWDGMRLFPYSIEEIASSVSSFVALINAEYFFEQHPEKRETGSFWDQIYNEPFCIDLAADDGSESRAMIEEKSFVDLFRQGFITLLKEEFKEAYQSAFYFAIFAKLRTPCYLYDFDKLRALFVTQIIPTQMYMRGQWGVPIFFSPGQLSVLGPN